MIAAAKDLRTIWLMGAKTRIVPDFIEGAVGDLLEPGGTLLDLCSGTGVVARSFAPRYRVFANDVQGFSAVIARAHLEGDKDWAAEIDRLDPEEDLAAAFDSNHRALRELFGDARDRERHLLAGVQAELAAKEPADEVVAYRKFLDETPSPECATASGAYADAAPRMAEWLQARRAQPALQPYGLISLYYQNVYFGVEQSLVLDSYRAAIDAIPETDPWCHQKRNLYLAALVYAASLSTSGTSHFAQPRSVRKDSELARVVDRRCLDMELQFAKGLDWIRREWGEVSHQPGNRVFCCDARELLAAGGQLAGEDVGLVYLDPPYTADNYSRFYHLLETLVNYDYPELERRAGDLTVGRYPVREKRHQSPFSSAARVEETFREIAQKTRNLGAKLLVSYSEDNGLLIKHWRNGGEENPVARFRQLFLDSFESVEIRDRQLMHSGQGDSNPEVRELLVLCES